MNEPLKRIRRWWICLRYHICKTHGTLKRPAGYGEGLFWICDTCDDENRGRNEHLEWKLQDARLEAQKRLDRDWAITKASKP